MGKNTLEPVGSGSTLVIGDTGTLTNDGTTKVGTLTGSGSLNTGTFTTQTFTGVFGDGVLAALAGFLSIPLYDVKPNAIKIPKVETTTLASRAETSQPGLPDYGEFEANIPYDSATTKAINSAIGKILFFTPTVDDFTSTDSGQTFMGWIMEYTPMGSEAKKNERTKANIKIAISGVALFTVGS